MGKPKDEGGVNASIVLYGFTFFLYTCIGVLMFILMLKRIQKKRTSEDNDMKEENRKDTQEDSKKLRPENKYQIGDGNIVEELDPGNTTLMEILQKETIFLDPSVDEIQELQDGPKNLETKKRD